MLRRKPVGGKKDKLAELKEPIRIRFVACSKTRVRWITNLEQSSITLLDTGMVLLTHITK